MKKFNTAVLFLCAVLIASNNVIAQKAPQIAFLSEKR